MDEVVIQRSLNQGGEGVDRVKVDERLTDPRVGYPVAELRPPPYRTLGASELVERWHDLPSIDPVRLRCDIDDVIDPSL